MRAVTAVDEFLDRVLASGLLSEAQLAHAGLPPTAVDAARVLVRERLLTPFQARTLLAGEPFSFYVTERYKILEHLGRGGMGEVYMVEHLLLRRVVAMKIILTADPQSGGGGAVERFFREARAVAALDHPNVVRVFDMDHTAGGPFLVMEYVDGSNLHAVVGKGGPLAVGRAVDAVRQAAAGLGHAHAAGLVHRDVKPGNMLLDRMGTVKVVDLGLARYRDANMNAGLTGMFDDNRVIGTADFQAPEQGLDSGSADARSDVYGLGAALFYLLTGRVPYPEGTITNKLLAHQMKPPPNAAEVNPEVPAALAAVIQRMMAKRPTDRPQSMAEARVVLAPWQEAELDPPPAGEMPKHPPAAYRLGLCPPPAVAVGAVLPVAADTGGYAAHPLSDTPRGVRTGPASQRLPRPVPGPVSQRMPRPDLSPLTQRLPKPPSSAGRRVIEAPPVSLPADEGDLAPVQLDGSTADAPVPAARVSRRGLLVGLGVGAVGATVVGGLLWYLNDGGAPRPTRPGPPVPPPPPPADKPVPPTGVVFKGSGSSFVQPAVDKWSKEYLALTGVEVAYSGGGSTKGIKNALEGDQPFGCSDDPVSNAEFDRYKVKAGDVLHIPLALGAVVPMYHLPKLKKPLEFTGPLLAQMFLGQIERWNDPRLSVISSEPLPDLPITLVYREKGSGTTAVFTDYLSKVSKDFEKQVGKSKEPKWPVPPVVGEDEEVKEQLDAARALEGEKSLGVAKRVKQKEGTLGYVELTYVLKEAGQYGVVENKRGKLISPTVESVTAAAAGELPSLPSDLRFSLTDADGDASYPIAACTWAILFKRQRRRDGGEELVKFLRWAVHDGQKLLPALKYAPLPDSLVAKIDAKLNEVVFTD